MAEDLRQALRSVRAGRGASLLAALALALGIGANTALFSLVDVLLFRPLPVREPGRLLRISSVERRGDVARGGVSYPLYAAALGAPLGFDGLLAFRDGVAMSLAAGAAAPETVSVSLVSGNYFEVLGLRPAFGRLLAPSDDLAGRAGDAAVLSHRFWQRRFESRREAAFAELRVNGRAFRVVGVAPVGFDGIALEKLPDVFLTIAGGAPIDPVLKTQYLFRSNPFFDVVARLPAGATQAQLQARVDAFAARLGAGRPAQDGPEADSDWRHPWLALRPAAEAVGGAGTALSRLLFGVVALVLLIACTDAAAILVARAERRRKEIATRIALGASRLRVARPLLLEGLLLSGAAALIGTLLAALLAPRLPALLPAQVPLPLQAASDVLSSRVLLVTAAVACLAGLAFSLLPALHAVRVEPAASLKAGAARSPRARVPLRAALVAVQVAVSAVLLAGAGLLLRTLHNALSLDAGFDARGVVVANVNLARAGHDTRSARALLAPLQERLASLAGVRSAALAQRLPLQGSSTTTVSADGHDFVVGYAMASPQYVATLGLRLLRGRDLDARDGPGRPYVGLVNEVLAARLWPGQDPLGRRIDRFSPKRASIEVVGLVRVRAGAPRGAPEPLLILPYAQMYDAFPWQPGVGMVMRSGDVRSTLLALPAAVATLDPALVVQGARTAEQELGLAFAQQRLLAWLLSGFAALALLLAVAGLFGLVSYGTETRRREFGIRAAIGARRRDVVRLVVLDALRPVAAGLALGVPGALACGRALAGQLFGVGYASPTVLGGAAVLLLLAAGAAAAAPARRAASVDPASALRSE